MKKKIYLLGVTMLLAAATVITGCNSPSDKADKAWDDVEDAQQELDEARTDAEIQQKKVATPEQWAQFKSETEIKIKENEIRIAELKVKIMKSGETLDKMRQKKIDALEEKNNELKNDLRDYERNNSDWETFKREFNSDMEELGQDFKDFINGDN
jgi:septal ring factor EnvC (AmiA/AmiB activator)